LQRIGHPLVDIVWLVEEVRTPPVDIVGLLAEDRTPTGGHCLAGRRG